MAKSYCVQYRVDDVVRMLSIVERKTRSADWRRNPIAIARMYRYASVELSVEKVTFYPPVAFPASQCVDVAITPCWTSGYGEPFRVAWGKLLCDIARAKAEGLAVASFYWSKR